MEKKGMRVGIASMGGSSKPIKYAAFWDARSRKDRKADLLKKAKAESFDFIILDFTAPFDDFFFPKDNLALMEKTDVFLLVFEAGSAPNEDAEALAKAIAERLEKRVIPVENKCDLVKKGKFAFPSKVVSVSAWEKI